MLPGYPVEVPDLKIIVHIGVSRMGEISYRIKSIS